ncbi:integral membrane protein [Patulibacter medicamentivorans]|uniref:Integral membrane protein n=1 Tax=Patulibacter medicamentivorans TaxID=1097667 RepID=H0E9H8_9ACTN|nr:hypothetical protein [Patulibacter medicamentivorans]EHN09670.1 integral membrane protein [Patulibacter medicamentivorans]
MAVSALVPVLRPHRRRRALLRTGQRVARRLPGAIESPAAIRRRTAAEQRTRTLAVVAAVTGAGAVALEVARVWRRGSAPLPSEADRVLDAGAEAVGETVQVAVAGYRQGSDRENALLNLLLSFTGTWLMTRLSTTMIRRRGRFGPLRDVVVSDTHVHHFVPGIAMAFLAGGASIAARSEAADRWLAVPFGAGVALTLDESALLLKLDDVYWTEEGAVSVQVTLASFAMLSTLLVASRMLRRGEQVVLAESRAADDDDRPTTHLHVVTA